MTLIKDPLKLARKWRDAGLDPEQADQMAIALSEELQGGDMVTKAALAEFETSLIWWFAALLVTQTALQAALIITVLRGALG